MKKLIKQNHTYDCGVAAVASILKHYNHPYSIETIQEISKCTNKGTTGLGLVKALKYYMFNVDAYQVDELSKELMLPAIIMIESEYGAHYVVLLKVSNKHFKYHDPAKGVVTLSKNQFYNIFLKIVFICQPTIKLIENECKQKKNFKINFSITKYIIIVVLMLLAICFGLASSVLIKHVIDNVNAFDSLIIFYIVSSIFLLDALKIFLEIFKNFYITRLLLDYKKDIYSLFLETFFELPFKFIKRKEEGELLVRYDDVSNIQKLYLDYTEIAFYGFYQLFILGIIIFIKPIVSIILVISSSALIYLLNKLSKQLKAINTRLFNVNTFTKNNFLSIIKGFYEIRMNKLTSQFKTEHQELVSEYVDEEYSSFKRIIKSSSVIEIIITIVSVTSLSTILSSTSKGIMSLGEFVLCYTLLNIFFTTFKMYPEKIVSISNSLVSINRINEISNYTSVSTNESFPTIDSIELNKVSFSYDYKTNILNNFSTRFSLGAINYLVGSNGSGKSTIINLILGVYKVDKGQILINNKSVINDSIDDITVISDESTLFEKSISFNIALSDQIDQEKFDQVKKILDINDCLIEKVIINNGFNLSSGEKQKILLARAIYKGVGAIILDEPFVYLDYNSKMRLNKFLSSQSQNTLIIVVTHNIEYIVKSQRVTNLNKEDFNENFN